jgi:hypothetical protein
MLFARSLISPGTLFSFSYFMCLLFSLCAPTGLQPRIWFLFINFEVSGVLGVEITVTPSHNIFSSLTRGMLFAWFRKDVWARRSEKYSKKSWWTGSLNRLYFFSSFYTVSFVSHRFQTLSLISSIASFRHSHYCFITSPSSLACYLCLLLIAHQNKVFLSIHLKVGRLTT